MEGSYVEGLNSVWQTSCQHGIHIHTTKKKKQQHEDHGYVVDSCLIMPPKLEFGVFILLLLLHGACHKIY